MRVAISGTHCSGKSTLIDAFLLAHPSFAYEPEPYTQLQDEYGDTFAAEPSADDFYQQLAFNIDQLRCYQPTDDVIYERCPVDFLAYLLALQDLRRSTAAVRLIELSIGSVMDALPLLDVIVFLPLNTADGVAVSDTEDPALRRAVDRRLIGLLSDDDFDLFPARRPMVVEAHGSTGQRLRVLETALRSQQAKGAGR
jgi:hypothetical protein